MSVVCHLEDGVGVVDIAGDRVGQGQGHGDQVEHRLVPVRPTQDGLGNPVIIGVLPWCKIEASIIEHCYIFPSNCSRIPSN